MLRLGDSNRPLRRELSSTLAVGWSSMSGIWPSERGRKLERTVRKSRVRSRLWRRPGNIDFEQRDRALRQAVREEFDRHADAGGHSRSR